MKTIEELIEGYRRFRGGVYSKQAALYRELGEGQSPAIMLIACADSRADDHRADRCCKHGAPTLPSDPKLFRHVAALSWADSCDPAEGIGCYQLGIGRRCGRGRGPACCVGGEPSQGGREWGGVEVHFCGIGAVDIGGGRQ